MRTDRFDIFGSTISSTGLTTILATNATHTEQLLLTNLTCPTVILQNIETVVSLFRRCKQGNFDINAPQCYDSNITQLRKQLEGFYCFNVQNWAEITKQLDHRASNISFDTLTQLGKIWRDAAAIYTSCLLHSLTDEFISVYSMIDEMIQAYSQLPMDNTLLKCLTWPTFVAGASSQTPEHRRWALANLNQIWKLTLCANATSAASVLLNLWEKHDSQPQREDVKWNWMAEISLLGQSWNFF